MDVDPSKIPVGPILFEHCLPRLAQSLIRGRPKIVAIGSSTTAGEGNIPPYPARLPPLLQVQNYSNLKFTVVNQGIGGQEAPNELLRFDTDVIAEKPDLVIWQVGTNAVWQSPGSTPPSGNFNETVTAIRDGLVKLDKETHADVILMDPQYVPAVLTPAIKDEAFKMVKAISDLAQEAGVNVFRRFAFMKGLQEVERASFDRMVDPGDNTRLHGSEWVTDRVTRALSDAILDGINRAWPCLAAKSS